MEQKFDGTPKAELRLNGRKVTRSTVMNDWGMQLRFVVKKDGKEVARLTVPAEWDSPEAVALVGSEPAWWIELETAKEKAGAVPARPNHGTSCFFIDF